MHLNTTAHLAFNQNKIQIVSEPAIVNYSNWVRFVLFEVFNMQLNVSAAFLPSILFLSFFLSCFFFFFFVVVVVVVVVPQTVQLCNPDASEFYGYAELTREMVMNQTEQAITSYLAKAIEDYNVPVTVCQ